MFGGDTPFLRPREWQVVLQYRQATSDLHYQGREPFPELDPFGPINKQHQLTFDVSYGITRRLSVSATVPVVFNSFAVNRVPPGQTQLQWGETQARGMADAGVRVNWWLLKARDGATWNLLGSVGLKAPTGAAGVTDTIYGREVPVDISIQPGDKAWAPAAGLYGYKVFPWFTAFGSANYMFNARGTTYVPTFFGTLNNPRNTAVNSSTDQFMYQFGASIRAPKHWPIPLVAYRISGVPVLDVFGPDWGFRRPGTIGQFEPGLSYSIGGHTFTATVPITTYVNIKDSPFTARIEDATVPKYAFTLTYVKRFR